MREAGLMGPGKGSVRWPHSRGETSESVEAASSSQSAAALESTAKSNRSSSADSNWEQRCLKLPIFHLLPQAVRSLN